MAENSQSIYQEMNSAHTVRLTLFAISIVFIAALTSGVIYAVSIQTLRASSNLPTVVDSGPSSEPILQSVTKNESAQRNTSTVSVDGRTFSATSNRPIHESYTSPDGTARVRVSIDNQHQETPIAE